MGVVVGVTIAGVGVGVGVDVEVATGALEVREDNETFSRLGTRTGPENIEPRALSLSFPPLRMNREEVTEVGVFSVTFPKGKRLTGVTSMGFRFKTKLEAVLWVDR